MDNNNFNQQGYGQQFQNIEPTQPVFPQQSAQTGMNQQYGQPAQQNMGQQYSQSAQTGANQQYGQPAQQNMGQQFANMQQSVQNSANQQYGQSAQQNMGQQYAQPTQQNMNQQYAQSAQQNMNQQYAQPAQQNTRQQYEQPQNNFNNYSNGNNGGDNGGNGGKKTGLIIGIIIAAIVIIGGIVATVLLLNKNKADDKDKNSGKETTTAEVTTTESTTTEMTTTEATTTEMTTTEATTTEATTTETATTESLNPDQIPEGTKYYILSDMTENGQESGEFAEDLKMLEGYKVAYLLFYPDGTGYIYVYSTFDDEFTYDATSVTITGEKVNMTSDGNNVYLDDGYYTIVLKEITKAEFDSLQDLPEDLDEY